MKRKNILKFVSLLGIGSFVMLAAASCSQAANTTQNPSSRTELGGGRMMDMSGGNANTNSNQGMMNSAETELNLARAQLTSLIDSENQNIVMYEDYAKIQATLKKAFTDARDILVKTDSNAQSLKDAKSTLESAISSAEKEKADFDKENSELVTAYNSLKESFKNGESIVDTLTEANYSAIKNNLNDLLKKVEPFIRATLIPVTGDTPKAEEVTVANTPLATAIRLNAPWKVNADRLVNSFVKTALVKDGLTGLTDSYNMAQPGNYSFVGYSVPVDSVNWSFARRQVFESLVAPLVTPPAENGVPQPAPLTDVSWVYSLSGAARYKLTFRYFGANQDKAYLYFPYKSNMMDMENNSTMFGLQYSLNGGAAQEINFAQTQDSHTGGGSSGTDEGMNKSSEINLLPTVDDIKIARIALSNLKFNLNEVEFSVPEGKVAPMIGNMYITSSDSDANKSKIYSDIFGNTLNNENSPTSVTVDLLKGYSLATSYNTYIQRFTTLKEGDSDANISKPVYLVGFIGGAQPRIGSQNIQVSSFKNGNEHPNEINGKRTLTIYVNAPSAGEYNISGSYISANRTMGTNDAHRMDTVRSLTFKTKEENSLTINVMSKTHFMSLESFDTSNNSTSVGTTHENSVTKRTIKLEQGLNKIVLSRDTGDTPFIGNLTFTLSSTPQANAN
ncbi:FIVAR domain-containing protein [Mycoplasma tullyi]|uniref:FIVAR domain-containing protein n=1 Tax=Mycoplasma tullyi TaxID=1612150 RepID=A0A7D7Y5N9_9MOLU|nr:FIVAR domain-containing protein [Mycoplasma tullyi]QMT98697.1 FIVAR domain-containing protein [Mycoplasma tullyi]